MYLPPYAINAFYALHDLNESNGATEFTLGSHMYVRMHTGQSQGLGLEFRLELGFQWAVTCTYVLGIRVRFRISMGSHMYVCMQTGQSHACVHAMV